MVHETLRCEISRLRVSWEHFPSAPYRHAAPLEMTMAAGTPVVMFIKKGAAGAIGHTFGVRVQKGKVLKIDRPLAGGFVSLTGPSAPRVVDCRSTAMLIKSALRDWLSMSYSMLRILVIGSLRSPPKGETAEWYMKYMTLCFSSPYFSFPLEGNASKRQRVYKAERRFDTPSLS